MSRREHPKKLNATQRQALERLYERGRLPLSNRNGAGYLAGSTARRLRDLGLCRLSLRTGSWQEVASITEAGRRRVQEWRQLAGAAKR